MNPADVKRGKATRKRIYRFIERYSNKHGYAPSVREIGEGVGLYHNAVRLHLDKMREGGSLTYVDGRQRTIQLIERPTT